MWPRRKVRSKTRENTNDTDRATSARLLPNQIILRHVLYVSYQIDGRLSRSVPSKSNTNNSSPSPSCTHLLSLLTLLTNRSALAAAPRAHRHRIAPAELRRATPRPRLATTFRGDVRPRRAGAGGGGARVLLLRRPRGGRAPAARAPPLQGRGAWWSWGGGAAVRAEVRGAVDAARGGGGGGRGGADAGAAARRAARLALPLLPPCESFTCHLGRFSKSSELRS